MDIPRHGTCCCRAQFIQGPKVIYFYLICCDLFEKKKFNSRIATQNDKFFCIIRINRNFVRVHKLYWRGASNYL